MNEPKIRFNGFEGEWEELSFNTLFTKVNDANHNVSSDNYNPYGRYPILDQSKDFIVGYTDSVLPIEHDKPIIVFGDHTRELKYVDFPFCTGADGTQLLCLKDNTTNSKYAYYLCTSIKIPNTGYNRHFKYLKESDFYVPALAEQRAIASYFTSLDSLIQSTTKKIESLKQVKTANLQSMFPQEGETTPRVRFKGFEGEWEKVKLNTFAKRLTRKNTHLESTLALTIASAQGLVSQIDYFNNLVIGSNIRNYYLLNKGEFAYNKSYSNGYPFGSVKRLDRYEKGILSTLYITFSIDDSISSDYLTQFFETTLWHKEVAERSAEGARNHGLLNIGAEDFLAINIVKPRSKEEQQMISDYFISIDSQITLQSQRLEKLKQIKAACLDNMFV